MATKPKQRLMSIVRDLIQRVGVGKTPGHRPASLQINCAVFNIMASREVLDLMEHQFLTAGNDLMASMASGELDSELKREKLLAGYGEELHVLSVAGPDWTEACRIVALVGIRTNKPIGTDGSRNC
jgi:hypothetical protein